MSKQIKWTRRPDFNAIQYTDGSGELEFAVFKTTEGAEVTGNGTLQAPLTVKIQDGWKLVRDR